MLERLGEEVQTSTHNQCFEAKLENGYPVHPDLLYKVGCKEVYYKMQKCLANQVVRKQKQSNWEVAYPVKNILLKI